MSLPPSSTSAQNTSTAVIPTTAPAMSLDPARTLSGYGHLPMLTKENYMRWQTALKAYLTPYNHVRVLMRTTGAGGAIADPTPPTDATELASWRQSEQIAMGVVAGTSYELHLELVHKHEGGSVWELWKAIEALHVQKDASLRHEAWMHLFGHRKRPDESYVDYFRRGDGIGGRVERVTPTNLTGLQLIAELLRFAQISGLPTNDPLRRQLVSQRNVTYDDVYAAFLHTDTDAKAAAEVESANAAFILRCYRCLQAGHIGKDCPHGEVIDRAVAQRIAPNVGFNNGNKGQRKKPRTPQGSTSSGNASANAASTSSGTSTTPSTPNHETAGVASISRPLPPPHANHWLVDSGATSSMTNDRAAFATLRPGRRAICMANGTVIHSKGVGSIRFLSDCGYLVTINNVLFIPSLAASLFAPNKFAREQHGTYTEMMDFPLCRWVNSQSGATEFTATITSNDLAYLDWKPAPSIESANVTMSELHARLNHIPCSAIQCLVWSRALPGLPRSANGDSRGDFCEDCINGKLTRAPHTKPAARAERPLSRIFSDVHGPLPVHSRRGHSYWVTFIDDYSCFPAVYFIAKKSDVFEAFRKFKAWAENVTGQRIGILRDDKGGEYIGGDFDDFLAEAGIRREHSIRDTPQQLGAAEHMNRSIGEGITTVLSQSGLGRTWWEDAAMHCVSGRVRIPSSVTAPLTSFDLFYGRKPDVSTLRPFGCLAYVHLQKDQRPALTPHAVQCLLIGYPPDYKGWRI